MTLSTVKKNRGGQNKHWAEKVRVAIWYAQIKQRCNYSNQVLDNLFAWTDEGAASRSKDDVKPRTFEAISKVYRMPTGRAKCWRDTHELLAAVDQHPVFNGTKALYTSEFWDILQEQKTWTPNSVQMRVDNILETNGLIRVNHNGSPALLALIKKYGHAQIFDDCLIMSLREMSSLSGMELVWLVYLQTEPTRNWTLRERVESIADKQLEDFFFQYFPIREHLNIYSKAIETFQRFRLDMSEQSGYGYLETTGAWPIIPHKLFDNISERHNSNIL